MSREETGSRTLWYVLFAFVAVVLFAGRFMLMGDGGGEFSRSQRDLAWVALDERKHLVRDVDADGRVDCLRPTGFSGMTGIVETWAVDGARCGRLGRRMPMEPEMREVLSRMLAIKYEADLAHHDMLDHDGDGQVDCTLNVHNTRYALTASGPEACPGRDATGAGPLDAARAAELHELLGLEARLGELVARRRGGR